MSSSNPIKEILEMLVIESQYDYCPPAYKAAKQVRLAEEAIESVIQERERQAVDNYIKPHIELCQEANGVAYCKNCGLEPREDDDNRPD